VGDEVGVRRLDRSARRVLDRLHERVGAAGLAAAVAVPGLGAVVDQHAAAVRDILTTGVQSGAAVAGTVLLAGYAQGVLDHLRDTGRSPLVPADLAGWRRADWASVRLLAVCALARNLRPGHRIGATDDLPALG
jgi:hypothetical protein